MSRRPRTLTSESDEDPQTVDSRGAPRFSVAVDVVALSVVARELVALLVARGEPPQRGRWSLPGGFLRADETLAHAAARVLEHQGGLRDVYLEQLFTFGAAARNPRAPVLSVAYCALVTPGRFALPGVTGSVRPVPLHVPWTGEQGGPVDARAPDGSLLPLAFDHAHILGTAVKRLRGKLAYSPVAFELLGHTFTLRQLQDVHEAILGRKLNKDSFRRRINASGQIEPTGQRQDDVGHRPARLFRFRPLDVAAYLADRPA